MTEGEVERAYLEVVTSLLADAETVRRASGVAWTDAQLMCPTPEAPWPYDVMMTELPLSTFNVKRQLRADPATIARARFPVTNVPHHTEAPSSGPPQPQPAPPDNLRPLGEAPWWQSLQRSVDEMVIDFLFTARTRKTHTHRRRQTTDWVITEEEAAPFTGGLIWDLRRAATAATVDWSLAVPLDTSFVQSDSFHIGKHSPPDEDSTPSEGEYRPARMKIPPLGIATVATGDAPSLAGLRVQVRRRYEKWPTCQTFRTKPYCMILSITARAKQMYRGKRFCRNTIKVRLRTGTR